MKSIIITGANGGLGLSVTEKLIGEGYNVIAATGKMGAGQLPSHRQLSWREVDLLDEKAAELFVAEALHSAPDLDAAVLLVGGFAMGKLTETTKAELEKMIDLNFYSAYHLVRPLLKHFLERPEGGRFILVGSRPGLDAAAGKDFFAYSLSKAMIFKLAEFINAEGKGKNVTATVIVPSTIDTEANRKAMPNADFSKWVTPKAIADTIAFYLSDEGRMIREGIVKVYNQT